MIDLDTNLGATAAGDGAPRSQNNAGDGVNVATGNVSLVQTDFTTSREGIPSELNLQFYRTYNSQSDYDESPLGYGWTHNYNLKVTYELFSTYALMRESGQVLYFTDTGGDWFQGENGVRNKLKKNAQNGYVFTTTGHLTYIFDSSGKLIEIKDLHDNRLTLTYTAGDKLKQVADDFGGTIVFHYGANDTSDYISKVTDPCGKEYIYYSGTNLWAVTYPVEAGADPQNRFYRYEDPVDSHNLTSIRDENGEIYTTYAYDTSDRAISARKAEDADSIDISYSNNQIVRVTDAFSRQTEYTREVIDGMAYITAIEAAQSSGGVCSTCAPVGSYDYSAEHTVQGLTDANGNQSGFTYDDWGNILTRTVAVGSDEERTVTNTYDDLTMPDGLPLNRVETTEIASVDHPGGNRKRVIQLYYKQADDAYGKKGDLYRVDETGYVNQVQVTRTIDIRRNAFGQMTRIDGPRTDVSDVIRYTYYPNTPAYGNNRGRVNQVITPAGTARYLNYDAMGRPLQVRDVNNVTTTYTYWPRGWLKTRTTAGTTWSYEYDKVGNLARSEDPEGRETLYRYDAAHRLVEIEDGLGNRRMYTLDDNGNRVKEEIFTNQGNLVKTVSMTYDENNRLDRVTNPDGTWRQYTYDANGNTIAVRDENGDVTQYEYDALDRMVKTIAVMDGPDPETQYAYDGHDNLTLVTDALNRATGYIYDDFGQVLFVNSPNTGQSEYKYDPAGNLIQKTDAEYTTTTYNYDALNRLTGIDFPDDNDIVYTYDSTLVTHGKGRLTGMSYSIIDHTYAYDAWGRLAQEETSLMSVVRDTSYIYDDAGLLTAITYPGGRVIGYVRDVAGNVTRVTNNGQVLADDIEYMPFGPRRQLKNRPSNIIQTRQFDQGYRLTGLQAGSLLDWQYNYYGNGRIRSVTGQALPAMEDLNETYHMEPGTNRIDRIVDSTTRHAAYDANGNLTALGDRVYVYNDDQRLKQAKLDDGTFLGSYQYDGMGRRYRKGAVGLGYIINHYDASGNLIVEATDNGNTIRAEYVYLNGERLAKIDSATNNVYHYINDHLGTPVKMINQSGQVVWSAAYTPFGEAHVDPSSTVENNFRYRGQYYDAETGLHYNWHRYYDPSLGRYLESDPIGQSGGLNLYAYAGSDPVNASDPFGLFMYAWGLNMSAYGDLLDPVNASDPRGLYTEEWKYAGYTWEEWQDDVELMCYWMEQEFGYTFGPGAHLCGGWSDGSGYSGSGSGGGDFGGSDFGQTSNDFGNYSYSSPEYYRGDGWVGTVEPILVEIGSGIAQAGQGLWSALGNEVLQTGAVEGFLRAGKVVVLTKAFVAVKAGGLYSVASTPAAMLPMTVNNTGLNIMDGWPPVPPSNPAGVGIASGSLAVEWALSPPPWR